jgi:hypothetical protein
MSKSVQRPTPDETVDSVLPLDAERVHDLQDALDAKEANLDSATVEQDATAPRAAGPTGNDKPAPKDISSEDAMPKREPDPFDPAALRLSQDFDAALGVKKMLLTVPVRKPDRTWFVRVHPDEAYRLQTAVIELKEERETYLVSQALWTELAAEVTFRPKLLATAINRQGVVFLWEANLPRSDGRADGWSRTALEAVNLAVTRWVRVVANLALGGYEVYEAAGNYPEPQWPELPFVELLRIAFKGRVIESLNHPVPRRLRGEV